MGRLHFGFRGTQRPPAPTHCCSQLRRLHHTQHSSQTSPSSGMGTVRAHQRSLRKGMKGQSIIPECDRRGFKCLRGMFTLCRINTPVREATVSRRDALSNFVEINTEFMSSQPRVCLAHIRPRISTALALLQELAAADPSLGTGSGAAGECRAVRGVCAPGPAGRGPPQPCQPQARLRARWDGASSSLQQRLDVLRRLRWV